MRYYKAWGTVTSGTSFAIKSETEISAKEIMDAVDGTEIPICHQCSDDIDSPTLWISEDDKKQDLIEITEAEYLAMVEEGKPYVDEEEL
jgi:hypothetical protein